MWKNDKGKNIPIRNGWTVRKYKIFGEKKRNKLTDKEEGRERGWDKKKGVNKRTCLKTKKKNGSIEYFMA